MVNNMDFVGYKYYFLIHCNGLFFGKSILQQDSILRKLILCYLFTVPETPLFRRFLKKNGDQKTTLPERRAAVLCVPISNKNLASLQ
jgi:hypothetical protein